MNLIGKTIEYVSVILNTVVLVWGIITVMIPRLIELGIDQLMNNRTTNTIISQLKWQILKNRKTISKITTTMGALWITTAILGYCTLLIRTRKMAFTSAIALIIVVIIEAGIVGVMTMYIQLHTAITSIITTIVVIQMTLIAINTAVALLRCT